MLKVNTQFLEQLEAEFLPTDVSTLPSGCSILGYGEISTVISVTDPDCGMYAVKRIPLFESGEDAAGYALFYERYNILLQEAGLSTPPYAGVAVKSRNGNFSVMLAQEMQPAETFCHRLIHQLPKEDSLRLIGSVFTEMKKVWDFHPAGIRLGLDGQLSNWAVRGGENGKLGDTIHLIYLDTSTPFINENGLELLDKGMFMKSAPFFLRPVLYFLAQGIIERYYNLRSVVVDLLANLIKEGKSDLLEDSLIIANDFLAGAMEGEEFKVISLKEVNGYYKEDKMTWEVYLKFRRFDRWLRTKVLRMGYEFLLPGPIKR